MSEVGESRGDNSQYDVVRIMKYDPETMQRHRDHDACTPPNRTVRGLRVVLRRSYYVLLPHPTPC